MTGDGNFAGRRVLVTGGASGIGEATALLLAGRGARVAILDINELKLKAIAGRIGGHGVHVDLSDPSATAKAVEAAAEAMGGLDGVVNCAGVALRTPLADLELAAWSLVVAVNFTAPYVICRAALPYLKVSKRASVVNVASGVGLLPGKGAGVAYASTKAGLIGMTRSLAAELAPGIRVNAICPGLTATPMVVSLIEEGVAAGRPHPADGYALRRAADPGEIASGICFLLGDEASFVTGSTLGVDGGRVFH